jgi:hypothetical protein
MLIAIRRSSSASANKLKKSIFEDISLAAVVSCPAGARGAAISLKRRTGLEDV